MVSTSRNERGTTAAQGNDTIQDLSSATLPEYQSIIPDSLDLSIAELSTIEQQVLTSAFIGLNPNRLVENDITVHPASEALILQDALRSLMYKK